MNLHMPQNVLAETELRNLAAIPYQIISPSGNVPIIGIYQDSLLGSYRMTRPDVNFTPSQAMDLLMMFNKVDTKALREAGTKISSFDVLSQIMPPLTMIYKTKLFEENEDYKTSNNVLEIRAGKYIRGQLEKSVLGSTTKGILHRVFNDFGNMACADFNDDLQNIVTEYMKSSSYSVGISDLIADKITQEKIIQVINAQKSEVQQLIDKVHLGIFENNTAHTNMAEFETTVNNSLNKATEQSGKIGRTSLSPTNRFLMIVNSGSKGSLINISQMISCLGQQNVDGKRIPYGFDSRTLPHYNKFDDSPNARGFIENSYISGLTAPELFFHAMGGRIGLIDTAVKSVTWETPIVLIENGKPKYIEIGKWIDDKLEKNNDYVQHFDEKNMELLNTNEIYIPTTDENGVVTWGEITAVTRHDPGTRLYEIKTSGGRSVTVTESKSLLIWNPETRKLNEMLTPDIKVGDSVPVTGELCKPPIVLNHINVSDYLPKSEFVYGADFNLALNMMNSEMEGRGKITAEWWEKNNGSIFTLPYSKKSSLQRTKIRSNVRNIQPGNVYPYSAIRKNTCIPEKFELTEDNGIFIGLFLAEGNADKTGHVTITNNNENIRSFVKSWFDKHSIIYKERSRINKIGGLTTTITGTCCVLAKFLTKMVGHGSDKKHIPTEAYIAPDEFIAGLLNGYYSGDGTVSKNSIDVGSASKRLIEGISMLCSRFGIFGKMSKSQLKSNNLNTKNIKPTYRLSIRAQWGHIFSKRISFLEESKNIKMKAIQWGTCHRNFDTYNNIVLDKIIEINIIGVEKHPKMYDLTIPSTLNFGLANGLQVRDTSQTGYIQRRLIKGLEDLKVEYDMTVRNSKGKIIQFAYGDDGFDSTKVENQAIPLVGMSVEDVYMHYDIIGVNDQTSDTIAVYTKGAVSRMKKQKAEAKEKCKYYVEKMLEARETIVKSVFKNKNDNNVVQPVSFQNIIANIQGQLGLGANSTVDITPMEAFELIEDNFKKMNMLAFAPITKLFEILYYYYLSPKELLVQKRFHRKALISLLETVSLRFKEALVHPGEMVGVIAGQSTGEPTTQLTLNSVTYETEILVRNSKKEIKSIQIGDFTKWGIETSKKIDYMQDKDTTYAELSEYYEVPGVTEEGQTVWRRIEAVTQHPVINEDGSDTMLKVTTKGNREVTTTKAKGFLQLIDGKIVGVDGGSLKVGDYLPVSKKTIAYATAYDNNGTDLLPHNKYEFYENASYLSLIPDSIPNIVDGITVMQDRNGLFPDIEFDQIVSIEHVKNTTNYAYDLTVEDTRNFDCRNGICQKDTFHLSGVASKSNVTRGVPRIEEILRLTKNPKHPSLTVYLKPIDQEDKDKATKYSTILEHTRLVDVVKSIQICFDPNEESSSVEEDRLLLDQFYEFERIMKECAEDTSEMSGSQKSKWVVRMEMDAETLLDKNITMDDIHFAISNSHYGNDVSCVYSDYNSDKLVFRIRMNSAVFNKGKKRGVPDTLDQSDEIYMLKNFQDSLLNNIVLRGVNGIDNVIARKLQNNVLKEEGKYVKKDIWVLDTTGSNMLEILALDFIDPGRTYSNDIREVFNVLGIEAARQMIYNEMSEVMEFSSVYINYHHLSLLADRMTCNHNMVPIFRSGLLSDNVGPIAKATFEVHTEVLLEAARHGDFDHMKGVSASVMCGQYGSYGTGSFGLVLDMVEMEKLDNAMVDIRNASDDIEKAFNSMEDNADMCSKNKIQIRNNVVNIVGRGDDTTCDDDYDAGF
jgi:DNA-directed RNA polymerase beta' subunit